MPRPRSHAVYILYSGWHYVADTLCKSSHSEYEVKLLS